MRPVINDEDELNKVINKEAWERVRLIRLAEREAERRAENEADRMLCCCFLPCYILFILWILGAFI